MLGRVLLTEILKIKRTLALAMVVIAPFVIVALYFLIGFFGADQIAKRTPDYWPQLARQTVGLWTILMMPLFLTLETSLLAGVEHIDKNWKSVLALPAPRWTIYVSKLIVTTGMLWMAHAVLVGGTIAGAEVLSVSRPQLKLEHLSLSLLVSPMLRVSVAALCATAIQHWVSLRWQSFTAAMGFGMCAMIVGFIAANSADYGPWIPWSMSMFAVRAQNTVAIAADTSMRVVLVALAGAAIITTVGAVEFTKREIT